MKCKKCNQEVNSNASFCPNCGNKITNNSSKIVLIILLIVLLLGLVITGIILSPKLIDNKPKTKEIKQEIKTSKVKDVLDENKYYYVADIDPKNIKVKNEDDLSKNIKIIKKIYKENHLYILAKNNNGIPIMPTIYLNFYDKNNDRVDRSLDLGNAVDKDKYFLIDLWVRSEEDFVSYDISISCNKLKSYQHVIDEDKSLLNVNETEDSIELTYKNTTNKELQVNATVIYYKNNKIYYFDDTVLFIDPNEEEKGTVGFYQLPKYSYEKPKDFDKYEIVITSVYYYDSEY